MLEHIGMTGIFSLGAFCHWLQNQLLPREREGDVKMGSEQVPGAWSASLG